MTDNFGRIKANVEAFFGRSNSTFESYLANTLQDGLDSIARELNLWFLSVYPDSSFFSNFPFANEAAVEAMPNTGGFMSRGWFFTTENVMKYQVAEPATPTWNTISIDGILYLKKYNLTGGEEGHVGIVDPTVFYTYDLSERGTPEIATIEDGQIILQPCPDNTYVYSVAYRRTSLGALAADADTNDFITNYPQLALMLGMMYAALYYKALDQYTFFKNEIYGPKGLMSKVANSNRKHFVSKDNLVPDLMSPIAQPDGCHATSKGYWRGYRGC